jgi:hypothetical protein
MFIRIGDRIINVTRLAYAKYSPDVANPKLVMYFGEPQQGNNEWPLVLYREEAESVWRILQTVPGLISLPQGK